VTKTGSGNNKAAEEKAKKDAKEAKDKLAKDKAAKEKAEKEAKEAKEKAAKDKAAKEKAEKQNKSLTTELEGVNSRLELARQSQKDIAAQYKEAKTGAAQAQEQVIGAMKAMFDREQTRALQEYRRKESMLESMVKAYEQRIAQSKTQQDKRDAESKETKAKRDIQAHQAILPKIKAGTAKEHTDKLRLKTNLETLTAQVQREKADEKATKEKHEKKQVEVEKAKAEKTAKEISDLNEAFQPVVAAYNLNRVLGDIAANKKSKDDAQKARIQEAIDLLAGGFNIPTFPDKTRDKLAKQLKKQLK